MKQAKLLKLILLPLTLSFLVGCASQGTTTSNSNNQTSSEPEPDITEVDPFDVNVLLPSSEEYLEFWDSSSKLTFTIEMSQEAANFINEHQSSHDDSRFHDYYVPCTFNFVINNHPIKTYEEVGIRQKGNMSRTQILEGDNFSLDKLAHYKLSFKETFDDDEYTTLSELAPFKKTWEDDSARKERKKRTLFGMEKIDIKWNRNHDETRSKQAYALKTFREQGVLSGRSTLAQIGIKITGKTGVASVYEVLEVIDSVFIKRHFDEARADGDLYKCSWQNAKADFNPKYTVGKEIGIEDNVNYYHPAYDLKTNKKKSDHSSLLNLIKVMNDKTSSANEYKTNISKIFDIKGFMLYEAIAYLCGNFDDLRNNANNYYLYFASTTGIAYIIPYDFDRCFGSGTEGKKDYFTNFSPESTKMNCNGDWQSSNIYWRTICKSDSASSGHKNVERIESMRELYQSNIERLLNEKIISNESFTTFVNSFPTDYRGNPDGAGQDNTTFANYLNLKIKAIKDNLSNYNIEV